MMPFARAELQTPLLTFWYRVLFRLYLVFHTLVTDAIRGEVVVAERVGFTAKMRPKWRRRKPL